MKLRNGDTVVVISGKDKGKTGSVMRVLPGKGRIVVSGINMRTRHMKSTPQRAGQKIQYEASMHVSNVMFLDPKTKKRTRIGMLISAKGKKERMARRSGEVIAITKKSTAVNTAEKKTTKVNKKSTNAKASTEKENKTAVPAETQPAKKPFWKKIVSFGGDVDADATDAKKTNDDNAQQSAAPARTTSRGS